MEEQSNRSVIAGTIEAGVLQEALGRQHRASASGDLIGAVLPQLWSHGQIHECLA